MGLEPIGGRKLLNQTIEAILIEHSAILVAIKVDPNIKQLNLVFRKDKGEHRVWRVLTGQEWGLAGPERLQNCIPLYQNLRDYPHCCQIFRPWAIAGKLRGDRPIAPTPPCS